jgi:hypothetical protein
MHIENTKAYTYKVVVEAKEYRFIVEPCGSWELFEEVCNGETEDLEKLELVALGEFAPITSAVALGRFIEEVLQ